MTKVKKFVLITVPVLLALLYCFCLPRELFPVPRSTVLTASDGTLMGARISSSGQWCFPPAKTVPDKFGKCIIRYEDRRFHFHRGVDPLAVARAVKDNLVRGRVVSGASTITMQVIRMSRPGKPRNLPEKIIEAVLAMRLELRCTKDEILLLYASNAPFGGNVVGIDAAAWRYFGRPAEDLSWAESATLAVLPNSPGLIHPGRGRDRLLSKRNALLDALLKSGVIDASEWELAKDEPLPDKPRPIPDGAYHLLERARREVGVKTVRSTLDPALQARVEAIAAIRYPQYHSNLVDNMAVLVVEVATGRVLAYYGNTRSCDRSIRGADVDMVPARRSSGSTLKPILYAAMLQEGMILPGSLVKDTPYNYNNFSPHNYSRSFEGAVPACEVIQRSLNVPSVRMLEKYGVPEFLSLLHSLGFDTMDNDADHYGLSLILGGAEISLQNIVRAYYYLAAKLSGVPVARDIVCFEGTRNHVVSPSAIPVSNAASWLMFDALSQAGRPEEEGSWPDFSSGRRIAWKTGTSWGGRDAWSVGTDGGYVVGVWVGNSDGEGRPLMTGISYAAPVMFDVFSSLPRSSWFDIPVSEMTQIEVCAKSGFPASDICPERDTVWVPDIDVRPDRCRYHKLVHLDPAGQWQVDSDCCPPEQMLEEVRFVLPPAQEWYYSRCHADYRKLPPRHPASLSAGTSGRCPIDILYPLPGTTVVPARALDGVARGIVLRAAHSDPEAVLYWHLDDEYLGCTRDGHSIMCLPSEGRHTLTVLDGSGAQKSIVFTSR